MGTLRWFSRLGISLKPAPVVDQRAAGTVLSTSIVNDSRYMSSRDEQPWTAIARNPANPGAGFHNALLITPPGGYAVGLYDLRGSFALINMAARTTPVTWNAGPTAVPQPFADPDTTHALTIVEGNIATANLPTAQFEFTGLITGTYHLWMDSDPPLRLPVNQSLLIWTDAAAVAVGWYVKAQALYE